MAAAAGAVVVGDHDERLRRRHRLALEGERGDALARRFGHVDHVVDAALDLVEVVAGVAAVDQRLLAGLLRVDAVEAPRGLLQPGLEAGAVDLHRGQRVGIEVQVGGAAQGQRAGGHVGVVGRAAEAGAERGSGPEHRHVGQPGMGERQFAAHVVDLRSIDRRQRGHVALVGEVAAHAQRARADRRVDVGDRGLLHARHQWRDRGVRRHAVVLVLADRPHLAVAVVPVDHPAAVLAVEHQRDQAQVLAEEAAHHRRHVAHETAAGVDVLHAGVARAGEFGVRVAEQQHVDAGHAGQVPAGVLHVAGVGVGVQAAVQQRHDQVGMLRLQFGQVFARGLDHAGDGDLAGQVVLVPLHDRRRGEADDADLQRHPDVAAVGRVGVDGLLHDRPRLEDRRAVACAVDVGQHQREMRPGAMRAAAAVDVHRRAGDLGQEAQPVVELVVAGRAAVVADRVHRAVHRQFLVAGHRLDQRLVVGQHAALDGVARIEQEMVGVLGARTPDQRGGALEADRGIALQPVVVVAEHGGVDVGGFQDRHLRAGAVGHAAGAPRQRGAAGQRQCGQRQQGEGERGGSDGHEGSGNSR